MAGFFASIKERFRISGDIRRLKKKNAELQAIIESMQEGKNDHERSLNSEKLMKSLFEEAANAFILIDQNQRVMLLNSMARKIFGTDIDSADFKALFNEIISIAGAENNEDIYDELLNGEFRKREVSVKSPEGLRYCVFNRKSINQPKSRQQSTLISLFDITERKQIEEKLNQSLKLLNEAQEAAHVGYWELDIINNRLYWSDEIYRIFGLQPREFKATYEAFLERVHPEDREFVNNAYTQSLENKTPYSIEHKILLHDGTIKHVKEHCKTDYDSEGNPVRSIGMVLDITQAKRTEAELQESKAIIQTAMDHSPAGIAIADAPDGRLRYVNEAGIMIRGKPETEIVTDIRIKDYPEVWQIYHRDKTLYKEEEVPLARAILFGEKCKREFLIKRTDGVFRHVLADAAPILDKDKNVISAIVVFLDISDLKAKEVELQKYQDQLEQMVQDRTKALEEKVKEVENLNKLFVGREFRINELKEKIAKLESLLDKGAN